MATSGKAPELSPSVQAFRSILLLAQRLRYLMDDRLRQDGLSTQQAALLTVVSALGAPSLTQAATALGTSHQNVAQLVAVLERKGLLRTEPDPADRRRRRLVTTAENADLWQQRDPVDHAVVADWFATLSTTEIEQLCALTIRLITGLDEPYRTARQGTLSLPTQ